MVCEKCGLPEDLCICESIAKEEEKIEISMEKRKFGKPMTVIKNISKDVNPKKLTKSLKKKLACGGTYKNGKIELQGRHLRKAEEILKKQGFPEEKIVVKK